MCVNVCLLQRCVEHLTVFISIRCRQWNSDQIHRYSFSAWLFPTSAKQLRCLSRLPVVPVPVEIDNERSPSISRGMTTMRIARNQQVSVLLWNENKNPFIFDRNTKRKSRDFSYFLFCFTLADLSMENASSAVPHPTLKKMFSIVFPIVFGRTSNRHPTGKGPVVGTGEGNNNVFMYHRHLVLCHLWFFYPMQRSFVCDGHT